MQSIVNMPVELFIDGYIAYQASQNVNLPRGRNLQKDRMLRSALVLLYASMEAELNRQLNVTSYSDPRGVDIKLLEVLNAKATPADKQALQPEMDVNNPESFRRVRNGTAHFAGEHNLYEVIERNIGRYFDFTKKFFEIVHGPDQVADWLKDL